ncbi:hypothetical protein D3C80_1253230 [compost metagenome]
MGLFTVDEQDRPRRDLGDVGQDRQVHERQGRGLRPGVARIDRTLMVAARRAVVVVIVDHKLRRVRRDSGIIRCLIGRRSGFGIRPTLPAQLLQRLGTSLQSHAVVVALRHDAGHVIHGTGDHGFDALVDRDGAQRHAAPAADADHADTLAVDSIVQAEIVHAGHEILGVDVGGCDIARLTAAFAGIGWIESQRGEAALGHGLRIET